MFDFSSRYILNVSKTIYCHQWLTESKYYVLKVPVFVSLLLGQIHGMARCRWIRFGKLTFYLLCTNESRSKLLFELCLANLISLSNICLLIDRNKRNTEKTFEIKNKKVQSEFSSNGESTEIRFVRGRHQKEQVLLYYHVFP